MDYKGQYLSEILYFIITILFGVVAWVYGYVTKDFSNTLYGWFIGAAIATVLCVPDWPFFNRNPVQWLEDLPDHPQPKSSKK
mmetsp:Transcript_6442/g.10543  ORF Transcript_6442/g.10543 Transcript_6442/m.10543 type:complete len:82 (+) Transcript_6442:153-398(+)